MDRNVQGLGVLLLAPRSLSARRAWIEIILRNEKYIGVYVALRKESVDRNIRLAVGIAPQNNVALRKESVDRNLIISRLLCVRIRRSPQGERG